MLFGRRGPHLRWSLRVGMITSAFLVASIIATQAGDNILMNVIAAQARAQAAVARAAAVAQAAAAARAALAAQAAAAARAHIAMQVEPAAQNARAEAAQNARAEAAKPRLVLLHPQVVPVVDVASKRIEVREQKPELNELALTRRDNDGEKRKHKHKRHHHHRHPYGDSDGDGDDED